MKKVIGFLLFWGAVFGSVEGKPICFFTKERTGTTWSLYITQFFTHKQFRGLGHLRKIIEPKPHKNLEVDLELTPIYRTHRIADMPKNLAKRGGLLVVTMRDYHECLFRGGPRQVSQINNRIEFWLDDYAQILRYYDQYPRHLRKLVHYENLIENPEEEIGDLFAFLQDHEVALEEHCEEFLVHHEAHKKYSVKHYHDAMHSFTKGNQIHFHKKNLSPLVIKEMEEYLKKKHPDVWEKYLSCYQIRGEE